MRKLTLLLLIPFMHLCLLSYAQRDILLQSFSVENGLSQNTVNYIFQDSKGFMWIGTHDGLNRFDGNHFTIFKNTEDDSLSIQSNDHYCAFEDRNGQLYFGNGWGISIFNRRKEIFENIRFEKDDFYSMRPVWSIIEASDPNFLWIGASGGLFRFDIHTKAIKHFILNDELPGANSVRCQRIDKQGNLWLGTHGGGIYSFDTNTERFTAYIHVNTNKSSLSDNIVQTIFEDSKRTLWIGTDNGVLNRFNPKDSTFSQFPVSTSRYMSIFSILEDKSGILWVGTDKGGLFQFDQKNEQFISISNKTEPKINVVRALYEDAKGDLWIGTYGAGIFLYDKLDNNFHYFLPFENNPEGNFSNSILSVCEDNQDGTLWIGTDGGGLVNYNASSNISIHYLYTGAGSITGNTVLCIKQSRNGKLYIGTFLDGLSVYDKQTGRFTNYKPEADKENKLNDNTIWDIYEDDEGKIWLATNNGGINIFDPDTKTFRYLMNDRNNPGSLSSNSVRCIFRDSHNFLWIGTVTGFNLYNPLDSSFRNYFFQPGNPQGLSNNSILCIYEDYYKNLWLGTHGGGLNRFDIKKGTFINYKEKEGLPGNVIYGILEDEQGNLWLSTEKGLSRFNTASGVCKNFDANSGMYNAQFNIGSHHKSRQGELFFGSKNGVCHFFPGHIKQNHYIPPVYITGFTLFNKAVEIGENSPLKKTITETDTLILNHKQSVINLSFSALNYSHSSRNLYSYILEPFEKEWNTADYRNNATYTNLDPGKYSFKVKASNNDGIWNETPRVITLIITPPIYKTWWFRSLLILIVILLFLTVYRIKSQSIRRQNEKLEHLVEIRAHEIEEKNKLLIDSEKRNAQLTQDQLQNIVHHKSKELSKYTLLIIQKNRLLEELKKKLREALRNPVGNNRDSFKAIIRSMNNNFSPDKEWNEFDANFNRVHENFAEMLKSRFPDLTYNDLRLCALYRIDIPTRDIANIMGISVTSVKMARYRLRKKLELGADENLTRFLSQFQNATIQEN